MTSYSLLKEKLGDVLTSLTERERKMRVIATGGLSPLFARGTEIIEAADGDLTMRGLVLIHRFNKTGKYDG